MWFGAADLVLDADDPDYPTEVDAEIIGGVTMAFSIISPAILASSHFPSFQELFMNHITKMLNL